MLLLGEREQIGHGPTIDGAISPSGFPDGVGSRRSPSGLRAVAGRGCSALDEGLERRPSGAPR
jgi:hypothetical protein